MERDEEFDIYSVMRSEDMREYYRNNISLSAEQQESVIINCYKSMIEQKELLKKLACKLSDEEQKCVEEMIALYEMMITLFYNPGKLYPRSRVLYSVRQNRLKKEFGQGDSFRGIWDTYTEYVEYYDTAEEVLAYVNQHKNTSEIFCVDELVISEQGKRLNPAEYYIVSVDGCYVPIRCILDYKLENSESWRTAASRYGDSSSWHIDLPFEHGSKVKFQLPIMDEPIYGVLWRGLDGNGCWYNFLYPTGTDIDQITGNTEFLDLSYILIDLTSNYSIFDWLESAGAL